MSVTEKISITIGRAELAHARRLAARLGLSLSTFISSAVREQLAEQDRRAAAAAVLASFPAGDRATAEEMTELLERWGQARQAPARARRAPRPRAAPVTPARARRGHPTRQGGR